MKKPKLVQINPEMLRSDLQNLTIEAKRVIRSIKESENKIQELRRDLEDCDSDLEDARWDLSSLLDQIEDIEAEFCREKPADDPASEGIRAAREEAAGIIQIVPHPPEIAELTPDQIQDAKQRFSDAKERN